MATATATRPANTKPPAQRRTKSKKVPQRMTRGDIEQMVTDRILKLLDDGQLPPWERGWVSTPHGDTMNAIRQAPYRGINRWITMIAQMLGGYDDHRYVTFLQAKDLGGSVRKGEKATPIVYYARKPVKDDQDQAQSGDTGVIDLQDAEQGGEADEAKIRYRAILKYYSVFNVEQTDGCELEPLATPELADHSPIEAAEAIRAGMPMPPEIVTTFHRNDPPHYMPSTDRILLPDMSRYDSPERWYSTLFHEMTHSTGHTSRLDRFRKEKENAATSSIHDYGREELVAGMGAAMLAAIAGIEHSTIENNAAYIKHWRDQIAGDRTMVLRAAALAQASTDHIRGVASPQG